VLGVHGHVMLGRLSVGLETWRQDMSTGEHKETIADKGHRYGNRVRQTAKQMDTDRDTLTTGRTQTWKEMMECLAGA